MPWEGPATELFAPPVASASVAEPATELLGGFGPRRAAHPPRVRPSTRCSARHSSASTRRARLPPWVRPRRARSATREPAAPRPPRAPHPALAEGAASGRRIPRRPARPRRAVLPRNEAAAPGDGPGGHRDAQGIRHAHPEPDADRPAGRSARGRKLQVDRAARRRVPRPFTSPWAEKFTVVDCAVPHPAQMVARGVFAETPPAAGDGSAPATPSVGGEASSYPGVDALQAQINLLCTTPGVIDFAAAGAYTDIQIHGSYPATAEQWDDGDAQLLLLRHPVVGRAAHRQRRGPEGSVPRLDARRAGRRRAAQRAVGGLRGPTRSGPSSTSSNTPFSISSGRNG